MLHHTSYFNTKTHSDEPPIWTNWQKGQPNNFLGKEHCVKMDDQGKMLDTYCENENSLICAVKPHTKYSLKGVCIKSPIDSFYDLSTSQELSGLLQTSMVFSQENKRWEIIFSVNKSLLGKASKNISQVVCLMHRM